MYIHTYIHTYIHACIPKRHFHMYLPCFATFCYLSHCIIAKCMQNAYLKLHICVYWVHDKVRTVPLTSLFSSFSVAG